MEERNRLLALGALAVAAATFLWAVFREKSKSVFGKTSTSTSAWRPLFYPGSKVLLVGDSLAQGLGPVLARAAKNDQVAFSSLALQSTRIPYWSRSEQLAAKLSEYRPTLVLISLGTNDAGLANPETEMAELDLLIRNASRGGDAVVGWIYPPDLPTLPRVAMVRAMLDASKAATETSMLRFDSTKLKIPRIQDQVHPTESGYKLWGDAIWAFLGGSHV